MDKYKKGKNVEEPFEKHQIQIKDLPENFLWMHVNPGTKMRNVLDYALEEMKTRSAVVWSGSGPAVGKVISCAEIMKRRDTYHQVNRICFRKVKEYWDPLLEDLDPLVVVRELPTIHILLSKDPVDTSQPGYQAPSTKNNQRNYNPKQQNNQQRRKVDIQKFESFGLRSNRTKNSKRKFQEPRASEKSQEEQVTERRGKPQEHSSRYKNTAKPQEKVHQPRASEKSQEEQVTERRGKPQEHSSRYKNTAKPQEKVHQETIREDQEGMNKEFARNKNINKTHTNVQPTNAGPSGVG